jgi:Xaa-Pro aminopeptidase
MRLEKLRKALHAQGLDAILITRPENQRYFSGFTGGEAALLITQDAAFLLTDFRYYEQVAEEAPGFSLVKVEAKLSQVLRELLKKQGVKTLGFESTHLSCSEYQTLRRGTRGVKWVPASDVAEDIRMIKDADELARMKKAITIADAACDHIRDWIQPGMTEKQVAWELEKHMRNHGADGIAFSFIVGSGPNGAKPHAVPQDRPIREGEPVVLDMGARVDGYNSDLTRTICIGKPDAKLQEIHGIVLCAQEAAEKGARPGMQGQEIDAIARKVITDAGYGDYFGHGLGHGVGLAVHEKPRANRLSENVMQPGMVVTIEPGIYLPGWGGVRIEDIVVFTECGIDVPTRARKELHAR